MACCLLNLAQPLDRELCSKCAQQKHATVHKILFRFILDKAPPGTPPECSLCPSCDPLWHSIGYSSLTVPQGKQQQHPNKLPPTAVVQTNTTTARNEDAVGLSVGGVVADVSGSDYQAALAGKRSRKPAGSTSAQLVSKTVVASAGKNSSVPTELVQVMCNCPIPVPCKVVTVVKDGPNKGRPFFACTKPRLVISQGNVYMSN